MCVVYLCYVYVLVSAWYMHAMHSSMCGVYTAYAQYVLCVWGICVCCVVSKGVSSASPEVLGRIMCHQPLLL